MFSRLAIAADGPTMHDAVITVDGHALVGLTGVTLHMAPDDVTRVTLTLAVDRVDVTAEALAMLEAHVHTDERKADSATLGGLTPPVFEGHPLDAARWIEQADDLPAHIRITDAT